MEFNDAGHILGSAIVQVHLSGDTQQKTLVFSGDLGRYDQPVFHDPTAIQKADILFVESTYGDREELESDVMAELESVIQETVSRRGLLVIPAFAVGRTQTVVYYLQQLMSQGRIPEIPIFVDSPMAIGVTDLYKRHSTCHKLHDGNGNGSIFDFEQISYFRTKQTSKILNEIKGSSIIVSASGMATGGRVLHHLYHHLPNERDTILFVGYQAVGTRGRRVLEHEPIVKIFGQEVPVKAQVKQICGLSAHANRKELFRWLQNFEKAPKLTYVIHGEPEGALAFAGAIKERLGWHNVSVPDYLDSETLFWGI